MLSVLKNTPDFVMIEPERLAFSNIKPQVPENGAVKLDDITVSFEKTAHGCAVYLTAKKTPVSFVRLRFCVPFPTGARFLGDAWERSYGDLSWQGMNASRIMPWYCLSHHEGQTAGYGVCVRPNAFVSVQTDSYGVTFIADVRNGSHGVLLGGRTLKVCEIVSEVYADCSAFEAAKQFCRIMCTDPILPNEPIYGGNNWYYAYGMSSHEEIVNDAAYISALCENAEGVRPYMVVDDGWQFAHDVTTCNGGPWHKGNEKFPHMKALADDIKAQGCRAGIWLRPLNTTDESLPAHWRLAHRHEVLDPSVPEVLDYIKETFARIAGWGFTLIKHDFSTFDLFGRWGKEMDYRVTEDDFTFADRSKTSAEIVVGFYKAVLEGASGAYILGCNCIGHLGAGLMHAQRIGDDTSGLYWERTRQMGVNTLAFRLPQHRAFFDIDADCAGLTAKVDFAKNRQWLNLVAKSGTPLFVSVKPGTLSEEEYRVTAEALCQNSVQTDTCEPLDWFDTVTPAHWRINREEVTFDWYTDDGKENFGYHVE